MGIRQSELVTGVFVVVALAILAVLAFKSVGSLINAKTQFVAYFANVELLEENSVVAIRGKEVGKVLKIEPKITGEDVLIRVIFDIDPEAAASLRVGTEAKIEQASFLGTKYISVNPNFSGANLPMEDGRFVVSGKSVLGLMDQVIQMKTDYLEPTLQNLKEMSTNLNQKWLSDNNLERLTKTLDSTLQLVNQLKTDLDLTMDKINGSPDKPGTLDRANVLLDDAGLLVNDLRGNLNDISARAKGTLDKTDTMLTTADQTLRNTDDILTNTVKPKLGETLDSANILLKDLQNQVDHIVAGLDRVMDNTNTLLTHPDLYGTLHESRAALRQMKVLMATLSADPSQVLFGPSSDPALTAPVRPRDETEKRLAGRAQPYGY